MMNVYTGGAGILAAALANMAIAALLAYDAPGATVAAAVAVAVVGTLVALWSLLQEFTDPARHWERVARKAERQASTYLYDGSTVAAQRHLQAAHMARQVATQAHYFHTGRKGHHHG